MSGFQHDIAGGQGNLIATSVQSPNYATGSAGWQIRKDGSVEFNNGTFRGTVTAATIIGALIESAASGRRTTIDANGDIKVYNASGAVLLWFNNADNALFFYNDTGSSTQGALVQSLASAAGTDPFGTAYVQGIGVYITISLTKYILTFGQQNSLPAMSIQQASGGPVLPVIYGAAAAASTGCSSYINSGQSTIAAVASVIQAEDSVFSAITGGAISLQAGQVQLGQSGAGVWNDNTQQLNLPASGGPFILGETFHTVSLAAGLTGNLSGGVGIRVKKTPWNAIWIDVEVSAAATGTFTCGSLPDSTYYPNVNRHFAIASNSSNAQNVRVFVPTSGAVQVLVTGGAGAWGGGCSVMYPTN